MRAPQDRAQERCDVVAEHFGGRPAVDLLLRPADPVRERLIHEPVAQVAVEIGDGAGDVVGEQPQLPFLRLQRIADLDVVVDVGHYGEDAADAPADRAVGEERGADPAQFAFRVAVAPLVTDLRAGERPLDVALHLGKRVGVQQLGQRVAEQVVGGHADPVAERLIREAQLELPVEIDDRRADAVGDDPQPVLALPGFELQPLQRVDVGVGDEKAANRAGGAAIRVVIDANPDGRAPPRGELAFVPGPLAVEGRIDIGRVELEDLAPDDFDHLVPDHVVVALVGPIEKGLVDEAIAPVAIDVGKRQPQRVEVMLGERGQVLALGGHGRGRFDRNRSSRAK